MGSRIGRLWVAAALTTACWVFPAAVAAAGKSTIEADVIGALNPDGLMVRVIGSRRWALGGEQPGPLSPYIQGGLMLAATPAYAKGALQLEWLPQPVACPPGTALIGAFSPGSCSATCNTRGRGTATMDKPRSVRKNSKFGRRRMQRNSER